MSEERHSALARASRSPSSNKRYHDELDHKQEQNSGSHNGTTLYVTNIAPDSRTDTLRALFSRYGQIEECRVIKNPVTKESRGFAFISFINSKDADEAQRALEGKEVDGRLMRIEKAKRSRPHEPTPGQYMGPTGASVKYDQKGRLRPGYMPFYALPPPKGGPTIPDERISYRSRRGSEAGRYEPRYGREMEAGDRYDRYDRYDRSDRYDRRPPCDRSDRYMHEGDGHYMPEPCLSDRYGPRYDSRGPQIIGGGTWGYPDERRRGVEYREGRARSRSRDRYPPRGRERRSSSPIGSRGRYGSSRMMERRR